MDEQVMINKSTELSDVNLKRILTAIFQKLWLVIIAAIACAAIVLVATKLWVTPQYQAWGNAIQ